MANQFIEPPIETPFFEDEEKTIMSVAWQEWFGAIVRELSDTTEAVETATGIDSDLSLNSLEVKNDITTSDLGDIKSGKDVIAERDVLAGRNIEADGDASIDGDISGAAITGDSLDVTGEVESATLNVTGDADVGGDLDVTGDVAGATATIAGAITGASLDVTGEMESATANITGNADVGGDLDVVGDVGGATATIAGNATVGGTLVTSDDLTVKGAEDTDGIIYLSADEGDDNADKWRLVASKTAAGFTLESYATGAWVVVMTVDAAKKVTFHENVQLGDDADSTGFFGSEGDLFSNDGGCYWGNGMYAIANKYGPSLLMREYAKTKTLWYDIAATFTAATFTFLKAGETFVTDGVVVGDVLRITDASDASYIGATGEIIAVEETTITISLDSTGAASPDDLTGVDFVVINHPLMFVLDNGDVHFHIGVNAGASFKVHCDEANNDHALHYLITAGKDNHRAVFLEVDADIYSGICGNSVNFDATAFDDAAKVGHANCVLVDNAGATAGDVHGLSVSVTDTANTDMNVAAVGSNGNVDVIHQHLGTLASITAAFSYDTDTYTDRTTAFGDSGTNVQLFPSDDDYIYIAAAAKWDEINAILVTPASHTIIPTFEYVKDAGTWHAFTPDDSTSGFQNSGAITFDKDNLTDWGVRTVNEVTGAGDNVVDYYWIRIRRTRGTLPTPPTESTIKVTTLGTEFSWDKAGKVRTDIICVTDGVTEPDTISGVIQIYGNSADGNLKVKFGDGFVGTIAVDS
ncbi:MAG: hypothetical protein KOO63_05545 [Bacteroidales bacterium]|nr:hypothetical protein [Candidatus Latescibacterota bacterium]